MKEFVFIKQKSVKNKVILPTDYDRDENSIPGIYTTSSIRFYKRRIDELINYKKLKEIFLTMPPRDIRMNLRIFRSCMADFDIKDKMILLKGLGTVQEKDYDFSKGIIVVKNEHFMDIVEKRKIGTYLSLYGFDTEKEEDILHNDKTILYRVPGKKLLYSIKN